MLQTTTLTMPPALLCEPRILTLVAVCGADPNPNRPTWLPEGAGDS